MNPSRPFLYEAKLPIFHRFKSLLKRRKTIEYPPLDDRFKEGRRFARSFRENIPSTTASKTVTFKRDRAVSGGHSYIEYAILELVKILREDRFACALECGCDMCFKQKLWYPRATTFNQCGTYQLTIVRETLRSDACVLCLDKPPQILFLKCEHACCCVLCSESLKSCPMCKRKIRKSIPLVNLE